MPPKKKETDDVEKKARAIIRVKSPADWSRLIDEARSQHWRRLQITIQIREWLLAGKPASLDAASAMLRARGLEDQIEAVADIEDPLLREQAAQRIASDEGLCEFSRRAGVPGLWFPANNIKAGIKENWSVLGLMNDIRGSRKAIAEGVFVFCANSDSVPAAERDWVFLTDDMFPPVHVAVSHSIGPKGPVSSIKRHEYLVRPRIAFDLYVAHFASVETKLSDDDLAKTLIHFGEHGLGACRSQGFGKFDLLEVREIEAAATTPTNVRAAS